MSFPRKTKSRRHAHCEGKCEGCDAPLQVGHFDYDHVKPRAMGGDDSFENCRVLCFLCHEHKTSEHDVPWIAKSNRQRDKHIGAMEPSRRPLPCGKKSPFKRKVGGRVVRRAAER